MTEEDPDLLAGDNLDRLRGRNLTEELENARYQNNLLTEECRELEKERDEARRELCAAKRELCAAKRELCRDEAIIRLQRHRVHRDSEDVVGLAKEIAVERGWDCFKENT